MTSIIKGRGGGVRSVHITAKQGMRSGEAGRGVVQHGRAAYIFNAGIKVTSTIAT